MSLRKERKVKLGIFPLAFLNSLKHVGTSCRRRRPLSSSFHLSQEELKGEKNFGRKSQRENKVKAAAAAVVSRKVSSDGRNVRGQLGMKFFCSHFSSKRLRVFRTNLEW